LPFTFRERANNYPVYVSGAGRKLPCSPFGSRPKISLFTFREQAKITLLTFREQAKNCPVYLSGAGQEIPDNYVLIIAIGTNSISFMTTWPYIPEDRTRHNHRCENLKFCNISISYPQPMKYFDNGTQRRIRNCSSVHFFQNVTREVYIQ
jgi:hypothetical protein